ncbi:MAG: preprotein translocase subunit SecE [Clostridia bacterium]|nr:preprotein translocase subunit SecE [Clostridia bacterium]
MPSKNTKKKLKESAKSQQPAKVEEVVVETTENVEVETAAEVIETPKQQTNEKVKKNKKVEKKSSKIKKKTKEVFSELKKVNWPTVKQVAKKTATVLTVVAIFAVALLGIHKLLEVIYTLFINSIY